MVNGTRSKLLLLPSELKHRIAELSSNNSLASLARTHTAYQREAEQALYRTLSRPSLNCLETLATNSEKAGFVRFLDMKYVHYKNYDYGQPAIDFLLNALVNMRSLTDFRLRLPHRHWHKFWEATRKTLNNILCNDHFRLQTLYLHEGHDISQIIKSQTELQIFAMYDDYNSGFPILETLKQLRNAQLHVPVVLAFAYNVHGNINRISIFPALYSIDQHPIIHQILADSLDKDQRSYMFADAGEVVVLETYLVDSCDLPSIHVLTKNVTTMFPRIGYLFFYFKNFDEILSPEIREIISLFPHLKELSFEPWSPGHWRMRDRKIPEEIKMAYVKDWELACPELIHVLFWFIDGSILQKEHGEWILD